MLEDTDASYIVGEPRSIREITNVRVPEVGSTADTPYICLFYGLNTIAKRTSFDEDLETVVEKHILGFNLKKGYFHVLRSN